MTGLSILSLFVTSSFQAKGRGDSLFNDVYLSWILRSWLTIRCFSLLNSYSRRFTFNSSVCLLVQRRKVGRGSQPLQHSSLCVFWILVWLIGFSLSLIQGSYTPQRATCHWILFRSYISVGETVFATASEMGILKYFLGWLQCFSLLKLLHSTPRHLLINAFWLVKLWVGVTLPLAAPTTSSVMGSGTFMGHFGQRWTS